MGIENILVIADRMAEESAALERGADLALRTGVPLHLCLLGYSAPQGEASGEARRRYLDERRDWLSRQATALAARGIAVTSEYVDTDAPHRAVLAKTLQLQPGLVIKDIHPDSEYEWLVLAPDEERLRNVCPAPLLLVRADSRTLPRRILAAVDTGGGTQPADPVNDAIVETALAHGAASGAEVHIAHVFPRRAAGGDAYQILRDAEDEARAPEREYFDRFARSHGFGPERTHWLEGRPGHALTGMAADAGADLVVIGSAYHSRIARFFIELLGSTGEAVVGGTRCDVLFVKPPHFVVDLARRLDVEAICRNTGSPSASRPERRVYSASSASAGSAPRRQVAVR